MSSDIIRFFATKKDMINLFREYNGNLLFYNEKAVKSDEIITVYHDISELPNLGITHCQNHCFDIYVAITSESKLSIKEEILANGVKVKKINRENNADAIHFFPSAINAEEKSIIHGQFVAISNSSLAKKMYNRMCYIVKKQCQGYCGWWIGKEAMELYGNYRFITIGVGELELYDFKITDD